MDRVIVQPSDGTSPCHTWKARDCEYHAGEWPRKISKRSISWVGINLMVMSLICYWALLRKSSPAGLLPTSLRAVHDMDDDTGLLQNPYWTISSYPSSSSENTILSQRWSQKAIERYAWSSSNSTFHQSMGFSNSPSEKERQLIATCVEYRNVNTVTRKDDYPLPV